MRPRLVALLEPPDIITLINAALGVGAVIAVAYGDTVNAARLILLAVVADGLDGFVARRTTASEVGVQLDSLADVVSFGVAPAILVHAVARGAGLLVSLVPVVFVLAAIVRLAAYNVRDADSGGFTGAPSTLAGALVAAFYLAGAHRFLGTNQVAFYIALTIVLSYLMLVDVRYPELRNRDAVAMGAVIVGAVIVPGVFDSALVYVVLASLLGFLVFAPRAYWN